MSSEASESREPTSEQQQAPSETTYSRPPVGLLVGMGILLLAVVLIGVFGN